MLSSFGLRLNIILFLVISVLFFTPQLTFAQKNEPHYSHAEFRGFSIQQVDLNDRDDIANDQNLTIGAFNNSNKRYFHGDIALVRIHDRAIVPAK